MPQLTIDRDTLRAIVNDAVTAAVVPLVKRIAELERAIAHSKPVTVQGPLQGADREFGYRFGVDGLMSLGEACEFLGGIDVQTLNRRVGEGLIRKGKSNGGRYGRILVCRRSVNEYIAGLEV